VFRKLDAVTVFGAMMMLGAEDRRRLRAALDEADRETPADRG